MPDYTPIDTLHLLGYIFYPRQKFTSPPANAFDLFVPVETGINVSCRFYVGGELWPLILYFHGNGEVVSDYDHIAPLYNQRALNLVVSDYRGYGASGGSPTLGVISRDCHFIFKAVQEEISRQEFGGGLWIMGRSLGSISAIELACHWKYEFRALIIESGFVSILPVMKHIGLSLQMDDAADRIMEEALAMVRDITLPALIIHGEEDALVPVEEAKIFYDNLGSAEKKLLIIPGADHNDIMFAGMNQYLEAIKNFVTST